MLWICPSVSVKNDTKQTNSITMYNYLSSSSSYFLNNCSTISTSQGEGQLKGSVCKFSDIKFEDLIINIIYWGH